ncbi:MAG TPA: hypothetical protein DDZ84_02275 [Firmicutes bacterium]|nr:hypothetical protein [Bacillota bacterium]
MDWSISRPFTSVSYGRRWQGGTSVVTQRAFLGRGYCQDLSWAGFSWAGRFNLSSWWPVCWRSLLCVCCCGREKPAQSIKAIPEDLGPSGSGEATTLKVVAGLEMPTAGKIRVKGENIASLCRR